MKCKVCNKRSYKEYCWTHQPKKPINRLKRPRQVGKHGLKWAEFRDNVAKPYLTAKYGYKCVICGSRGKLDVDHIKKRGSHPELRYELTNVRFLCRKCHIEVT